MGFYFNKDSITPSKEKKFNNKFCFNINSISPISSKSPTPAATTLHQYDRVDGKATVAGFWTNGDGQRYAVCVADAAYRGVGHWGNFDGDVGLPYYNSSTLALNAQESATYNTDIILASQYASSATACIFVRNISAIAIDGKTFQGQLPNISEILMIYNDKDTLDTYDTTLTEYPDNSLSSWNIGGSSSYRVWSSTRISSYEDWILFYMYWSSRYSIDNAVQHNSTYGIIPIFEIPVDENGTVITN